MEERCYAVNPLVSRILPVAAVGAVGVLVGVAVIFLVRPAGLALGVAILALSALMETVFIVRAVHNLPCPQCHQSMRRAASSYTCDACQVNWLFPPQTH